MALKQLGPEETQHKSGQDQLKTKYDSLKQIVEKKRGSETTIFCREADFHQKFIKLMPWALRQNHSQQSSPWTKCLGSFWRHLVAFGRPLDFEGVPYF